jgi:hypothetical protein
VRLRLSQAHTALLVVLGALGRFVSDHAWWFHRGQGATTLDTGCVGSLSPSLKALPDKDLQTMLHIPD